MNDMNQNQLLLSGNRVKEHMLDKAARYELAATNLTKMVFVFRGVGLSTVAVLKREATMAHKRKLRLVRHK